jgi:hypothetical protein
MSTTVTLKTPASYFMDKTCAERVSPSAAMQVAVSTAGSPGKKHGKTELPVLVSFQLSAGVALVKKSASAVAMT